MIKNLLTVLIVFAVALAVLNYLNDSGRITLPEWFPTFKPEPYEPDGLSYVHFIDVGQGDCSLIIADNGETILIDPGEAEYSPRVIRYIKNLGITRLDYVLATHPHSDHIGGMARIISSDIEIGRFIMPMVREDIIPVTSIYEDMLIALSDKGCEVTSAKTETVEFGGGTLDFYTVDYTGDNLNNYSTVLKYTFGDNAFLFSGDCEADAELMYINEGFDLSADVYKAGHHGSSTSSSGEWLNKIDPTVCVIECGAGNSYGHPHAEALSRIRDHADIILRTDIDGNIVFTSDGRSVTYETSG